MATIIYHGELRDMVGQSEETVSAPNVHALLKYIDKTYGKKAMKQAKASLITVDSYNILKADGYQTAVSANSRVCFYPVCGGG
jgi:molybdopterin converting factor small subunit